MVSILSPERFRYYLLLIWQLVIYIVVDGTNHIPGIKYHDSCICSSN